MDRLTEFNEKTKTMELKSWNSDWLNKAGNKLGLVENLMEKYNIESVEELEKIIHKRWLMERIACRIEVFIEKDGKMKACRVYRMTDTGFYLYNGRYYNYSEYKQTFWLLSDRSE